MTSRERFLAAVRCQPTDRPPIWLMRQAGRYLPEYRDLKARYSFPTLVKTPELATEVALQPLRRFPDLDAAIVFSDILVVPEALGQPYDFLEGEGMRMAFALDSPNAVDRLDVSDIEEKLTYVAQTLRQLDRELGSQTVLLGFCGAPWTLAAYMIEGKPLLHCEKVQRFLFEHPSAFETLLQKITQALVAYLRLQVAAGVDAIQIFDSCASLCPGHRYEACSLKWIRMLVAALDYVCPIILFARSMSQHAEALVATGLQALSVDANVHMSALRKRLGEGIALQGNLAPSLLQTYPALVQSATQELLKDMASHPGYLVNLGHGVPPQAKIECVEAMVDTVRRFRRKIKINPLH